MIILLYHFFHLFFECLTCSCFAFCVFRMSNCPCLHIWVTADRLVHIQNYFEGSAYLIIITMADISNNTVKLSITQPDKDSVVTDEQVSVRMCSSTSNNLAVMNKRIDTGIYFIAIYAVIESLFFSLTNSIGGMIWR